MLEVTPISKDGVPGIDTDFLPDSMIVYAGKDGIIKDFVEKVCELKGKKDTTDDALEQNCNFKSLFRVFLRH